LISKITARTDEAKDEGKKKKESLEEAKKKPEIIP
jgi:hypothetical protein